MSHQCVIDACKACWKGGFISGVANKDNCLGLVKAVAKKLNAPRGANMYYKINNLKDLWSIFGAFGKNTSHYSLCICSIMPLQDCAFLQDKPPNSYYKTMACCWRGE